MAGIHHPEAGDAIDVFAAPGVVEVNAFALFENMETIVFRDLNPGRLLNPDVIECVLLDRRRGRRRRFRNWRVDHVSVSPRYCNVVHDVSTHIEVDVSAEYSAPMP